jgi:hypothetical protein
MFETKGSVVGKSITMIISSLLEFAGELMVRSVNILNES